jgi:hypothetical protein
MKITFVTALLCGLVSFPAVADGPGLQDDLLERLAGTWVLQGTIASQETTHDVAAEWVLGHYYLRLHEVSREHDGDGTPEYEAIVFLARDDAPGRYACLWLDSTGGSGLVAEGIGHATRDGDSLPFVFDDGTGSRIHNTFRYDRETDTWTWVIDNEREGARSGFAKVSLRRK